MNSELDHVSSAMKALEDAYRAVFSSVRTGMQADEIDAILSERLAANGAELLPGKSTPFVVDENGAPPKFRLDRAPLDKGRLWGMDNNVHRQGYYADLGRYGYTGELPETLVSDHGRVLKRQDEIAQETRPGRSMKDIFDSCAHDMPFEVHRIGLEQGMFPVCGNAIPNLLEGMERSDKENMVFEPGQVVCIEIWAGLCGGIEDMYVVEPDGVKRISTLPREIQAVPEERS